MEETNDKRNYNTFIKIKEIRDKINDLYSLIDKNELSREEIRKLKQKIDFMHVEKDLALYKLKREAQS